MPDVFERLFYRFEKSVSDYYTLTRLDPSYRIYYGKGDFALRDLQADMEEMGGTYFPSIKVQGLNANSKKNIEDSIEQDFRDGLTGIKKLPRCARFGVYLAYMYYLALYKKIKITPPEKILQTRIRIPNRCKATLWAYSFVRYQLNII